MKQVIRRLKGQSGLNVVDVSVAMLLLALVSLAFAGMFLGSAAATRNAGEMQSALELGRRTIERIKALPYPAVGLAAHGSHVNEPDWASVLCPLRDSDGTAQCVTNTVPGEGAQLQMTPAKIAETLDFESPNMGIGVARTACHGANVALCPLTSAVGPVVYSYVYWDNWADPTAPRRHKVVKVVVKFRDAKPWEELAQYNGRNVPGTVTLTASITDQPNIGQLK